MQYERGIQIEGTGTYDGRWGFNPDFESDEFNWWKMFAGGNLPAKIYDMNTGEKPYWFKITISNDINYARNVYNVIHADMGTANQIYNLYTDECYQWRNLMFLEADNK